MINQQILATGFKTPKEIVRWMGAMQAQDYPMAKWAIGIRLPDFTDKLVEAAFNKGEILRTHLLRPTWHFVSADDIYWMLELTAPNIIASMKFREKWLGLTKAILAKSNRVIEKALSPDRHLTRDELIAELNKAEVRTDEYRSGHLLMRAELEGLICSGDMKGTKQTYALLEKRVPRRKHRSREESLKELAQRYFSSRGPATLQDFAWWSGLPMSDARNALEMVKKDLVRETFRSAIRNSNSAMEYWIPNSPTLSPSLPKKRGGNPALRDGGESGTLQPTDKHNSALLLPAFDEFLIAYKDRSAAHGRGVEKKLISANGIFRPIIVIDGQATGSWKRIIDKDKLVIEMRFFRAPAKKERIGIQRAVERYGRFLEAGDISCREED